MKQHEACIEMPQEGMSYEPNTARRMHAMPDMYTSYCSRRKSFDVHAENRMAGMGNLLTMLFWSQNAQHFVMSMLLCSGPMLLAWILLRSVLECE